MNNREGIPYKTSRKVLIPPKLYRIQSRCKIWWRGSIVSIWGLELSLNRLSRAHSSAVNPPPPHLEIIRCYFVKTDTFSPSESIPGTWFGPWKISLYRSAKMSSSTHSNIRTWYSINFDSGLHKVSLGELLFGVTLCLTGIPVQTFCSSLCDQNRKVMQYICRPHAAPSLSF
jgi:hypothetical protein